MEDPKEPNAYKWALKVATSAGLAGMLCCVAPAVLFMFGLVSGVYAISFADFFYTEDGNAGVGAWALRALAVCTGALGVYSYKRRQNQCSLNPERKKKNLVLLTTITILLGLTIFLSLEKWSTWYFNKHIVPAQQNELFKPQLLKEMNSEAKRKSQ